MRGCWRDAERPCCFRDRRLQEKTLEDAVSAPLGESVTAARSNLSAREPFEMMLGGAPTCPPRPDPQVTEYCSAGCRRLQAAEETLGSVDKSDEA